MFRYSNESESINTSDPYIMKGIDSAKKACGVMIIINEHSSSSNILLTNKASVSLNKLNGNSITRPAVEEHNWSLSILTNCNNGNKK